MGQALGAWTMPKLSSSTPEWVKDLRKLIKRQHGMGWAIREQSGKAKLTRRWADGTTSSAMLELPWDSDSSTALLAQLESIRQRMDKGGLSLAEAAALEARAQASSAPGSGLSANGPNIDWAVVVERFRLHKTHHTGATKESTWERMYAPVMRQVLQVLAARPIPRDGRTVLAGMRDTFGGKPGSPGRRHRILYSAQLLRFAVEECGAAQQWRPPSGDGLQPFVGRKVAPGKDATPISDAQLLRLLQGIPDPRWRLAIGLLGCFGLRPVELRYCQPTADGSALAVSYCKRTSRGSTKPREVEGIDPLGGAGLSRQLLGQLQLSERVPGATKLPPLGPSDNGTASAISTYLQRRPTWQALREEAAAAGEKLTVYSLRHGYALRAHEAAGLSPRVTAQLMGHSMTTHTQHYGRWTDAETVATALERANQRMERLQLEHREHAA